ncbi:MAG: bifunctional acetate--CoA ligase family protein/GNAT family N-acetyltransferase [Candidatus Limnocylindrales bacterium]
MSITYPDSREADVVLRDGSSVHIRPARPADEPAILGFLQGISAESLWLRFAATGTDLAAVARRWAGAEGCDDCSLLAIAGVEGRVIGQAGYDRMTADRAEVGFTVTDAYQGRGVGTLLLERLAVAAEEDGVSVFEADVLPENHRMLEVFRESGFGITMQSEPGLIKIEFPTGMTAEARERFERREQTASVNAVRAMLQPRSIAVIGASRNRGTIGGEVFRNLLDGDFNGPVFPVNPKADVVQSVAAYHSILDIPGEVDMAVIIVPARIALGAARECAQKGVKGLTVITAGFGETGPEGKALQKQLLALCRDAGMRLVGPNCMGVINTAEGIRMNATFSPLAPLVGNVGFLSQSGALGLAAIEYANSLGLGLSSFVSVGNKADLSDTDFLDYWESDEGTDVVALYLESVGNPRKFARTARRVGRSKPILAVKSGRSTAGARATSSHTGALLGASDVTVDALFKQAGVIRTDTLGEFFDVASLLANQPLPKGSRVAILTNGGGPGILCADACEADGLVVPQTPDDLRAKLEEFLPAEAGLNNPVDMIAAAPAESYARAIKLLAEWDGIDAIIVLYVPVLVTTPEGIAQGVREAVLDLPRKLPVLAVFMSSKGAPAAIKSDGLNLPSYLFPEDAARALAHAVRYGEWQVRPHGTIPTFTDIRPAEGAAVIAEALASIDGAAEKDDGEAASRWLLPDEVARLFDCYGIPMATWRLAPTPEEAGKAAEEIGGPVALKAVAPGLIHKTEAKAVVLDLEGAAAVEAEANAMAERVAAQGTSVEKFFVQQMVRPGGVEMLVGVVHDKLFGPVVAAGAGGITVEVLKDIKVRITPLTDLDAHEMVTSLKTFPLLDGYRGAAKADVAGLEKVLLRVSAMVEAQPEIAEMDCNPVIVLPEGPVIVDARIRIESK